jgi:hypothetical protein
MNRIFDIGRVWFIRSSRTLDALLEFGGKGVVASLRRFISFQCNEMKCISFQAGLGCVKRETMQ